MYKTQRTAFVSVNQILLDIASICAAYYLSYYISTAFTNLRYMHEYAWVLIVFIPFWLYNMGNMGMYNRTTFNYYDRILKNILFSTLVTAVLSAALIFFIKEQIFSRILFFNFIVLVISLSGLVRYLHVFLRKKYRHVHADNAIIIGYNDIAGKYNYFLEKTNLAVNIIGCVGINGSTPPKGLKFLGRVENLYEILKKHVVDEVIFALPASYVGEVEKYVHLCEQMGITVRFVLNLYNMKISKSYLSYMGTLPVLTFHTVATNKIELFIKRIIDVVGALIGLALTGVFSIFIVPAVLIESRGPVLFTQDRVGVNGRVFKLYKFRSMFIDAEERKAELMKQNQVKGGFMFKLKDDPRITRVGAFLRKTSLDELPQFINVLKGDMSLVGTRPPTVDEVSRYESYHWRRISAKPGLTGLWQVSGRSNITDFDEVVKLDTQYLDKWSIWLDIKIIFKTVFVIFNKAGAY